MLDNKLVKLDRFRQDWAMTPVWEGDTVYNETVLMVPDKDGFAEAPLLYTPDAILSVRSDSLEKEFIVGKDYVIQGNRICRTAASEMPCFTYDEFWCPDETGELVMDYAPGGHIKVNGGWFFQPKVIHVSYTHHDRWPWPKPQYKGSLLPRVMKKLQTPEVLTIVFYGDSIVSGDEVTSFLNMEPQTPIWTAMFSRQLYTIYGSVIHMIDTALGGTDTKWGLAHAKTHVASFRPDIAVLGFGNNDRIPVEEYAGNMKLMMEMIREDSPETSFILVDPMVPHRQISRSTDGYRWVASQEQYTLANRRFECEGVVTMDNMDLHLHLRERKRFYDLSSNNINHPNDFMYRIMAQMCTALLVPPEKMR
ncbi:MAG: SGNH/GDSL hydrolase family protein [Saccharofermentanales bacterium]